MGTITMSLGGGVSTNGSPLKMRRAERQSSFGVPSERCIGQSAVSKRSIRARSLGATVDAQLRILFVSSIQRFAFASWYSS